MSAKNPFTLKTIQRSDSPSYRLKIDGVKKEIQVFFEDDIIFCEEGIDILKISHFQIVDLNGNLDLYLHDKKNIHNVPPFEIFKFVKSGLTYGIEYDCCLDNILDCEVVRHDPQLFLHAIKDEIKSSKQIVAECLDWRSELGLSIKILINNPTTIGACIACARESLQSIVAQAQLRLNSLHWDPIYEKNEQRFSREVILPLLQKMKFHSINYSHGNREFGKDFTFSEVDKFGQIRYYGIQVKAGNISGKVNSQIDDIISQIEDAFTMPFYDINSGHPQYISILIIITSKYFTENAKEKVIHKVNKGLYRRIYFLDKNKVQELIEEYWNR